MIYGHSEENIKNMSIEDVEMFIEFESLYKEINNKEIARHLAKALVGEK